MKEPVDLEQKIQVLGLIGRVGCTMVACLTYHGWVQKGQSYTTEYENFIMPSNPICKGDFQPTWKYYCESWLLQYTYASCNMKYVKLMF